MIPLNIYLACFVTDHYSPVIKTVYNVLKEADYKGKFHLIVLDLHDIDDCFIAGKLNIFNTNTLYGKREYLINFRTEDDVREFLNRFVKNGTDFN